MWRIASKKSPKAEVLPRRMGPHEQGAGYRRFGSDDYKYLMHEFNSGHTDVTLG